MASTYEISYSPYGFMSTFIRPEDQEEFLGQNVNSSKSNKDPVADSFRGPTECGLNISHDEDTNELSVFHEKIKTLSVSGHGVETVPLDGTQSSNQPSTPIVLDWAVHGLLPEDTAKFKFGIDCELNPPQIMRPPLLKNNHLHPTAFCTDKSIEHIVDVIRSTFDGKEYGYEEDIYESIFLIADLKCGLQVNLYVDDSAGFSVTQYVVEAQHYSGCGWKFMEMFKTLQEAVEGKNASHAVVLTSMTPTTLLGDAGVSNYAPDFEKHEDDHKKKSVEASAQC